MSFFLSLRFTPFPLNLATSVFKNTLQAAERQPFWEAPSALAAFALQGARGGSFHITLINFSTCYQREGSHCYQA